MKKSLATFLTLSLLGLNAFSAEVAKTDLAITREPAQEASSDGAPATENKKQISKTEKKHKAKKSKKKHKKAAAPVTQ